MADYRIFNRLKEGGKAYHKQLAVVMPLSFHQSPFFLLITIAPHLMAAVPRVL